MAKIYLYRSFHSLLLLFSYYSEVKSLSRVRLFANLWTVAQQAPQSMGFSRQEYWSGLPFPSLGDLPDPRIKPRSPALQADTLTSEPPGTCPSICYPMDCSTPSLWSLTISQRSLKLMSTEYHGNFFISIIVHMLPWWLRG